MSRTGPEDMAARRRVLLRAVRHMEWRRDGAVPWNGATAKHYASPEDLVLAVHARWYRILAVRLDPLLERGATADDVIAAWCEWAAETPGQRAVLDGVAAGATPALRQAQDRQDALLAAAAGLAPTGADTGLAAQAWRIAVGDRADAFRRRARVRTRCPAVQRWRCRHEEARQAA